MNSNDMKTSIPETGQNSQANGHFAVILAIYLLGLLIGGLYVGMVAPIRTVVQAGFGIDDSAGIWMINVYTLFYAALIPVIGNLADRHGRKVVYTTCVGLFALGSALCGISASAGGFGLLLFGRVVQAIGAGGMIPVANAEMGTSFPLEKRGMALGIAAAVVGISNVLGAGVGSFIVGIVGAQNWAVAFYIALPFCAAVIIGALIFLPNHTVETKGHLDLAGSVVLVVFVLALLVGLKNIDFFDFAGSIVQPLAWVPLVVAVFCLPVFRAVEHRASNPVFHMEYLHSRPIVITMAVSFFVGCVIISMMLVPEFAEFAMGDPVGSGGYYMLAIGLTSIIGPPLAGRLIDHVGPKPVLMGGLAVMVFGYLFLALFAAPHPSAVALIAGLAVVGAGMGFAMGAPANYMILENTDPDDSNSAIATITLVRQVGTSLAPAILVGFISQEAGMLGYQHMLLCVVAFNVIALALMAFYHSPERRG
jgi:MFS family permease